jgi:hypothetical protein
MVAGHEPAGTVAKVVVEHALDAMASIDDAKQIVT